MGSIASANYSTHSDGNAFTVKSEYNQYDDQDQNQLLHSSEEDSGNTSENRAQQDGQYYAGDAEGARAAFALGSLGPSSGPISASRATVSLFQYTATHRASVVDLALHLALYILKTIGKDAVPISVSLDTIQFNGTTGIRLTANH